MMRDRLHYVGVELEGQWLHCDAARRRARRMSRAHGVPIHWTSDGSLRGFYDSLGYGYVGELRVGPFKPAVVEDARTFRATLARVWPDRVNASAGLHVHVSFRSIETLAAMLLDRESLNYWALLRARLQGICDVSPLRGASAHVAWTDRQSERLAGGNTYCEPRAWAHVRGQVDGSTGGRYTAINGCAFNAHSTLEARIPAATEDPTLGRDVLLAVIRSARQSARIACWRHRVTIRAWRERRYGSFCWPWESADLMALDRDICGLIDPEADPDNDVDDPDWRADLVSAASVCAVCRGVFSVDRPTCPACGGSLRGSGVARDPF